MRERYSPVREGGSLPMAGMLVFGGIFEGILERFCPGTGTVLFPLWVVRTGLGALLLSSATPIQHSKLRLLLGCGRGFCLSGLCLSGRCSIFCKGFSAF